MTVYKKIWDRYTTVKCVVGNTSVPNKTATCYYPIIILLLFLYFIMSVRISTLLFYFCVRLDPSVTFSCFIPYNKSNTNITQHGNVVWCFCMCSCVENIQQPQCLCGCECECVKNLLQKLCVV